MNTQFNDLVLFGYSPLFADLARALSSSDVNLTVICGDRQLSEVNALGLCPGIQTLCLESLSQKAFLELEIQHKKAIGLSFGAPFIFRQSEIDIFKGNILNSHGAPLPEFKGGGGFSWRILQGDKRGTSLMHLVTTEIDEGPVVFRKDFTFDDEDKIPAQYQSKQLEYDRKLLVPWLTAVVLGEFPLHLPHLASLREPRVRSFQTYFPRLLTNFHAAIDWSWNAEQLQRFIRAFSRPYDGAYSFHRGSKVRFFDCEIVRETCNHPFVSGLVTDLSASLIEIAVSDGFLRVKPDDFFTDGRGLVLGDRLCTPASILEEIRLGRVVFRPDGPRLISESPSFS